MSFIFAGSAGHGLRIQYNDVDITAINSATSIANAHLLWHSSKACKVALFDNGFDVELGVAFVHPERDPDVVANRLKAFEIPALRPLNFDVSGTLGLSFDPGMWVYVWKMSGTANSGKLRLITWG